MGPASGEVRRIRQEWHQWEQQFQPAKPPKGTPNREVIRRENAIAAAARSSLPENEAIRREFRRRLRAAQRSACGMDGVINSRIGIYRVRRSVVEKLLSWGFEVTRDHGGSVYLERRGFAVRVSDHAIPETAERSGRPSWCRSPWQLILKIGTRQAFVDKWLSRVGAETRKSGHPACVEIDPLEVERPERV